MRFDYKFLILFLIVNIFMISFVHAVPSQVTNTEITAEVLNVEVVRYYEAYESMADITKLKIRIIDKPIGSNLPDEIEISAQHNGNNDLSQLKKIRVGSIINAIVSSWGDEYGSSQYLKEIQVLENYVPVSRDNQRVGFSFSFIVCSNGEKLELGSEIDCKPLEVWKKYAISYCENRCSEENGKCGVNSFSIAKACFYGIGTNNNVTTSSNQSMGLFSFSGWECYSGKEVQYGAQVGKETSCKSFESWEETAQEFCKDNCENECGVSFFNVTNRCLQETDEEISLTCENSCSFEDSCLPIGYRQKGKYCSGEGVFKFQLGGGEVCDNNFECSSNVCVSGKCIEEGLIIKILNWFKRLFS